METHSNLTTFLTQMAAFEAQFGANADAGPFAGPASLVLAKGEDYEWSPLPEGHEYGRAKECYANAWRLASDNPDYRYVEGFGDGGFIGAAHAWVIDPDGRVIDPTWRHSDTTECGLCEGNGEFIDDDDYEDGPCFLCNGEPVEHPDRTGSRYRGIVVPTDALMRITLSRGMFGVLDWPPLYESGLELEDPEFWPRLTLAAVERTR